MTPELDTSELRRLHAEATPGEWVAGRECVYVSTGHAVGDPDATDTRIVSCDQAVADLVAATRNALPALLDAYEAVREWGREYTENRRTDWGGPDTRAMDEVRRMGIALAEKCPSAAGKGWTDTTSYSRGDTERTPRTWEVEAPDVRIIVSRWVHAPGSWFLTCAAAGFDRRDLLTDDVGTAKAEALRLVATRTAKIAAYASRLAKGGE